MNQIRPNLFHANSLTLFTIITRDVNINPIRANFTGNVLITSIKPTFDGGEGGVKKCEKERKKEKKKRGERRGRGGRWLKQASRPTHETLTVLTVDRIVGGERREAKFAKGDKRQKKKKEQPRLPPCPLYLAGRSVPNWSHFVSRTHDSRCCHASEGKFLGMLRLRGKQRRRF